MEWDFKAGEVLLIDKPLEWTSFDVVNKIKYALRPAKIKVGHAGTLDPLATGLLIVCTGKKTKEISRYQEMEKEYTGKFLIGKTTPSFDSETEPDQEYPVGHITNELLEEARASFMGITEQVPPMYSAIKIDGKPAYSLARQGKQRELKARSIEITKFEIDQADFPEIDFEIVCSKGTYIRSIARDLGIKLNSGAYMTALRRERIGQYNVDDALTIEQMVAIIKKHNESL